MDDQARSPILIGLGILMMMLGIPLIWAGLGLPGTTGGSGSIWEYSIMLSFGLFAVLLGLLVLSFPTGRPSTFHYLLTFGAGVSVGLACWSLIERFKELGLF